MFLHLFTTTFLFANIYFFIKKKYLYIFIPSILFLPEYYGIELSYSLPLLTVSRILFLVFYIYAFVNRKRKFEFKKISFKDIPTEYKLISCYFLFRLISNFYYITTYGQAAKTVLEIIFEQLLLLVAFYILNPDNDELLKVIDILVYTGTFFFTVGIFESLSGIRPFDQLYTISRGVMNEHYIRLGLLRSTTTFGMPGLYANMCIFMIPLIIHLYKAHKQKRYLISFGLATLAIIHSGSRADMLYYFIILGFYFIFVIHNKKQRLNFIKNGVSIWLGLLIFIAICSICNPLYKYFYITSGKAILNEVGFEFNLSEGSPSESVDFGVNSVRGSITRTSQLTALKYTFENSPVFGMGSGSQIRGDALFYWFKTWQPLYSYDLGIVEIFCDEGFLGLTGICLLLACLLYLSKNRPFFSLFFITYLLSTFNTINMYSFLFTYLLILLYYNKELS